VNSGSKEQPIKQKEKIMNKKNALGMVWSGARIAGMLIVVATITACAQSPALAPANVTVTFSGDCPQSVSPNPVDVSHAQKIHWQSTPANKDFSIHYDPFHGRPINSNNNGLAKSPPIDSNAPLVEYKYTITAVNCGSPLDPHIVVH
jgi:hypothetical protein